MEISFVRPDTEKIQRATVYEDMPNHYRVTWMENDLPYIMDVRKSDILCPSNILIIKF